MNNWPDRVAAERAFIVRVARRFTRSAEDAEDLAQITLIKAIRHGGFEERSSLRTWLFHIVRNAALESVRVAVRRQDSLVRFGQPQLGTDPTTPLQELLDAERVTWLRREIEILHSPYREAVEAYLASPNPAAAAHAAGVPLTTYKVRLHRAKQMLKAHAA